MDQTIREFAKMDLQADDSAFAAWLSRKKSLAKTRARSRSVASNTSSNVISFQTQSIHHHYPKEASSSATPNSYADCSPAHSSGRHSRAVSVNETLQPNKLDHLENLLEKRTRSQKAFLAWVQHKEELQLAEEEKLQKHLAAQKRDQIASQHQEMLRKIRQQEAVSSWIESKNQQRRLEKERQERKKLEIESKQAEKERKCKEAFEKWKLEKELTMQLDKNGSPVTQNQKGSGAGSCPFVSHSKRWIDVAPNMLKETHLGNAKVNSRAKKQFGSKNHLKELLSPPNLYKDYSLYQQMAPSYMIKYPAQVASGGVGLSLKEFENDLVPQSNRETNSANTLNEPKPKLKSANTQQNRKTPAHKIHK